MEFKNKFRKEKIWDGILRIYILLPLESGFIVDSVV